MKKINVYEKAIEIKEGSNPGKYQVYKNAWGTTQKCVLGNNQEEVFFHFYDKGESMIKTFDTFKPNKLGKKKYQIIIGKSTIKVKGKKKEEIPTEYSGRKFGSVEVNCICKKIYILDNDGKEITRYSL